MKPAKSSARRHCRSATTRRSPLRSGGKRPDAARANLWPEPRCLAQRLVYPPLPARSAPPEMRNDVRIEPQRNELFGRRLLPAAIPAVRRNDLGRHLDGGAHASRHFVRDLEGVRISRNARPAFHVFLVSLRGKLAQRLAPCLAPHLIQFLRHIVLRRSFELSRC